MRKKLKKIIPQNNAFNQIKPQHITSLKDLQLISLLRLLDKENSIKIES